MRGNVGRSARSALSAAALGVVLHAGCAGATQSELFTSASGVGDAGVDSRFDGARAESGIVNAQPDAPPPVLDAAADAPRPQPIIACGSISCVAGTETCCAEHTGTSIKGDCRELNKCFGSGKFALSCDGDDDCQVIKKDSVCCVSYNQANGYATGSSCYQAKDCSGSSTRTRTCDPLATTSVCDEGDVCRVSTHTLIGYYLCLPPR
jgi:hypothetical protein